MPKYQKDSGKQGVINLYTDRELTYKYETLKAHLLSKAKKMGLAKKLVINDAIQK